MQFTDDAWIKLAALYWDKLGRIVPKHYEPPYDSATVKLLTQELGFVKNLYPTMRDLEIVSNMFLEVLEKHRETLIKHYGIHAQSSSDLLKEVLSGLSEEEEDSEPRFLTHCSVRYYHWKMCSDSRPVWHSALYP